MTLGLATGDLLHPLRDKPEKSISVTTRWVFPNQHPACLLVASSIMTLTWITDETPRDK